MRKITVVGGLVALVVLVYAVYEVKGQTSPLLAIPAANAAFQPRSLAPTSDIHTQDMTSTIYLPLIFSQQRHFPDTTNGIFVFNDQIYVNSLSDAQAQFAATHYVGSQKLTRAETRRLREYNPNFLVLHYRLGQALGHSEPIGCAPSTNYLQIINGNWVQEWPDSVQEDWFYHYPSSRVFNCIDGHYLMNLDDPDWRAWWSDQVIQQLQNNENDGLFADSYNIPNYGFTWNPPLPDVDATFESDWATREHAFTDYIRGQFAGRWKWIPNIGMFITSRDPSDYSNVDGVMMEGFAEWGSDTYFDLADWQLQMNRLLPLIAADKIILAQNYPSSVDNVNERLFILGTYLLVKGRYTYVNVDTSMEVEWLPEYAIDLGAPTDSLPADISTYLHPSGNVYWRHYTKGLVLVNPTDSPQAITLDGTYRLVTPSGGGDVPESGVAPGSLNYTSVTTVNLNAHQAAILLNTP